MTKQMNDRISACTVCEKFKRNIQKELLTQEETPKYPFHKISMDLYEYAGKDYIAIIDAYSGFLITEKLNGKTSKTIIDVINRKHFQ